MNSRRFRNIILFIFLLLNSVAHAQSRIYHDLTPLWDTVTVLKNPHEGWYIHYYDNSIKKYGSSLSPDDLLEDFPGLHVYLRLAVDSYGNLWQSDKESGCI
ncbi:MAG TPA: hypothetical protein VEY10_04345 [Flavisolibacter sp.]|jgi:hypothetical protein|nr:hypothetical protein [Flavisolibacter sp.]